MTIRNLFSSMKQHKNLTIREIVERTGLGYATVAHLCSPQGEYDSFTIDTLDKMCTCFGAAPNELIAHTFRPRGDTPQQITEAAGAGAAKTTEGATDAGALWEEMNAALYRFLYECCVVQPTVQVRKTLFWNAYQQWCDDDPARRKSFPRRSLAHWFSEFVQVGEKRNGQGQWMWTGVDLLSEVKTAAESRLLCGRLAAEYVKEREEAGGSGLGVEWGSRPMV